MRYDNLKAVVFDYGATLDTNGVHWYNIFRDEYLMEFPKLKDEDLRNAYVYGERMLAKQRMVSSNDTFLQVLEKKIRLQADFLTENGILEDISAETLKHLVDNCYSVPVSCTRKAQGILRELAMKYRIALISNFYGNVEAVLREFGLRDYFELVVESASVGYSKPDKRLYEYCLEHLGLKGEECLMIGDSYPKDIVPAKKLGFSTIWLKGRGWQKEDGSDASSADEIISDLQQVGELLG